MLSGTRTNAVRSNGGWKVNGSKNFITHAIACNTLVAVAVTDKEKGNRGISAFIFDKSMEGFRGDKKENKLGMRASETASVVFEDCYVPDENRSATRAKAFSRRCRSSTAAASRSRPCRSASLRELTKPR